MRKATKTIATWFGLAAGLAGLEHGFFEMLQGYTPTAGLMIPSMGAPCVPEKAWNGCEPALTLIPNFLVTGILAVLFGALLIVWSAAFVQRKEGGGVMLGLSAGMLLCGGGIFPPLIGVAGALAALQINRPVTRPATHPVWRLLARLWPWPFAVLILWLISQFVVGYFFNDLLRVVMGYAVLLILVLLPLSLCAGYAYDVQPPAGA